MITGLAIGILPVLLFLGALVLLDSYKLVALKTVLYALLAGSLCGALAYGVTTASIALHIDPDSYRRYGAPIIEESLKASYVVWLVHTRRVGFLVDATISGFAVGAGFALVENVYYAQVLGQEVLAVWIVRGLGTAVMHGGTTAIFAVIAQGASERRTVSSSIVGGLGLLFAIVMHSLYNHFFLNPLLSTVFVIVILPLLLAVVFIRSERSLRQWLGVGFDTDQELLFAITSGDVGSTHAGQYLLSLRSRFQPEDVVDMLCLLRIRLELSIQAKGILLMREAGFDVPADPSVAERLEELRALEHSIGPTGRIAMLPILHSSPRDLWQIHMLGSR